MDKYVVAPPSGSTNNSVGAADRKWEKGFFDKLPGWQEYLAESTGYGIVSGCEPTISGLTVTVAAGVVHLAGGTRKEIVSTNITLDPADDTNPRIDLVYIDADGTVAKVTGTAAASPSAPTLPSDGISVCNVTIAANAVTGVVDNIRKFTFTYVTPEQYGAVGDGVTDDTSAMRQAIGSGCIVVLSNNYYVNGTFYPKNNIVGTKNAKITVSSSQTGVLFFCQKDNISISNIVIEGNGNSSNPSYHGVNIAANNIVISKVTIKNVESDGIYIGGNKDANNIYIEKCIIDGAGRNGISIISSQNFYIKDCYISNITKQAPYSGIDIEPNNTNQKIIGTIENLTTENCYYSGLSIVLGNANTTNDNYVNVINHTSIHDGYDTTERIPVDSYVASILIVERNDCSKWNINLKNCYVTNAPVCGLRVKSLGTNSCVLDADVKFANMTVEPAFFSVNNLSTADITSYKLKLFCDNTVTANSGLIFQRVTEDVIRTYKILVDCNKHIGVGLTTAPVLIRAINEGNIILCGRVNTNGTMNKYNINLVGSSKTSTGKYKITYPSSYTLIGFQITPETSDSHAIAYSNTNGELIVETRTGTTLTDMPFSFTIYGRL